MNKAMSVLAGFGTGALFMYVWDPRTGRRRRALVRDKIAGSLHDSRHILDKTSRDVKNRAHGLAAGVRALVRRGDADADVLIARVRSRIGRVVSHPHAVHVTADNGRVVLEGPVLAAEAPRLLSCVSSVAGVHHVDNRLEVHEQPDIPALQGGSARRGDRFELMQSNWTPAVRVFMGAAGIAVSLHGFRRGGLIGWAEALGGGAMLLRATTNEELRQALGRDGEHCAVTIQKTMNVLAPVEDVYRFWTNYENLPRFMTHLREVRDLGNGRSHWTAAGPAGMPVSWEAETTENIPNCLVRWRSLPGSRIDVRGCVRFDSNTDGGARISLRISYTPPAGVLGHAVATLFGADPKNEIDQDLIRLKSLLEFGKTRAHGEMVTKEEFPSPQKTMTSGNL